VGERVRIGDQISVTVVRINGSSVRLGIEAPPEYAVVREELEERMKSDPTPGEELRVE
jgi:carbon storage regulator